MVVHAIRPPTQSTILRGFALVAVPLPVTAPAEAVAAHPALIQELQRRFRL